MEVGAAAAVLGNMESAKAAGILASMGKEQATALLLSMDSAQAAAMLGQMDTKAAMGILQTMDTASAAKMMGSLDAKTAAQILGSMEAAEAVKMLGHMDAAAAAGALNHLSSAEAAELLSQLSLVQQGAILASMDAVSQRMSACGSPTIQSRSYKMARELIHGMGKEAFKVLRMMDPAKAGAVMSGMSAEKVCQVLEGMEDSYVAKALGAMNADEALEVMKLMGHARAAAVLAEMDPNIAALLMSQMSEEETIQRGEGGVVGAAVADGIHEQLRAICAELGPEQLALILQHADPSLVAKFLAEGLLDAGTVAAVLQRIALSNEQQAVLILEHLELAVRLGPAPAIELAIAMGPVVLAVAGPGVQRVAAALTTELVLAESVVVMRVQRVLLEQRVRGVALGMQRVGMAVLPPVERTTGWARQAETRTGPVLQTMAVVPAPAAAVKQATERMWRLLSKLDKETALQILRSLELEEQAALLNACPEVVEVSYLVASMEDTWRNNLMPLLSYELKVQVGSARLLMVIKEFKNGAVFKKMREATWNFLKINKLKKKLVMLLREMDAALAEIQRFKAPNKTLLAMLLGLLWFVDAPKLKEAMSPDLEIPKHDGALRVTWRSLIQLIRPKPKGNLKSTTALMVIAQSQLESSESVTEEEERYMAAALRYFSQIDEQAVQRAFVPAKVLYSYLKCFVDLYWAMKQQHKFVQGTS
eukprot:gene1749-2410_t